MKPPMLWYEIRFSKEVPPERVEAIVRTVAGDRRPHLIVLETVVRRSGVSYFIAAPTGRVSELARLIRTLLPGTAVAKVARATVPAPRYAATLQISGRHRPLLPAVAEPVTRGVLAALQSLAADEAVIVQHVIGPRRPSRPVGQQLPLLGPADVARELVHGPHAAPDTLKAARDKHALPAVQAQIRLGFAVDGPARAHQLAAAALTALRQAETPGVRFSLRRSRAAGVATAGSPWRWPLRLNSEELTTLLLWPVGDGEYPGIDRRGPRLLPPAPAIPRTGKVLGLSTWPGPERPIALGTDDALRHVHLLGPTGAGKSVLALRMILSDIDAGHGVCVVDPQGDLVESLLARIPDTRRNDVVVLDPTDVRPVGLNPLATDAAPELVADQLLAVFHGLSGEAWGRRIQDVMHAALLTLAKRPDMTICALPVLLTNAAFRRSLTAGEHDVALAPFWAWFEGLSDAERSTVIAPVMSRVRELILRPRMRAVLGQAQPKLHLPGVLAQRPIVLVTLAEGQLGPGAASLLGSLVVSMLWQAVLGRVTLPPEERAPVFVYLDEVQRLLHIPQDLSDVLARSRALGVGWVLAHQHLAQLPPDMRSSMLSNARTRVALQLGAEDAIVLARSSPELTAHDFQSLPPFHAYAAVMAAGAVSPYASMRTLPPPPAVRPPDELRARSRERYGVDAAEVEKSLAVLFAGPTPPPAAPQAIGKRPRRTP